MTTHLTTSRNSQFCSMCQELFATVYDTSKSQINYHYDTWDELIHSAKSGCLLCNQLMSGLLQDDQDEVSSRLKSLPPLPDWYPDDGPRDNTSRIIYWKDDGPQDSFCVLGNRSAELGPSFCGQSIIRFELWDSALLGDQNTTAPTGDSLPTSLDIDDKETWQTVSRWLSTCESDHQNCHDDVSDRSWMPTRLIDVQFQGGENDQVQLVVTSEISAPGDHRYTTLSHRWGEHRPITLSVGTMQNLRDGYPVHHLPKTFLHAVQITRKLGIRYIWIDSLCIQQDSTEDWKSESQKMWQVYGGSWCNIAACGAKDSTEGCLLASNANTARPFKADIRWSNGADTQIDFRTFTVLRDDTWEKYVHDDVLGRRAWVLQERALSPKQLNFTRAGIFWECRTLNATQYLPNGPYIRGHDQPLKRFSYRLENVDHLPVRHGSGFSLYEEWGNIVESYSGSQLTKPTDRLVAIAGLASKMQSKTGDQYLAGLWRKNLLLQLCWMVSRSSFDHERHRPLLAPTWSWSSLQSPIIIPIDEEECYRPLAEIMEVEVDQQSGTGHLRLRVIPEIGKCRRENVGAGAEIKLDIPDVTGGKARMDERNDIGQVLCVPLVMYCGTVMGILLLPSQNDSKEFERVGSWSFGIDESNKGFAAILAQAFRHLQHIPEEEKSTISREIVII